MGHQVRKLVVTALVAFGIAFAAASFVTIRGGDWTIGTASSYCGVYWPHGDVYCQHGS